MTAARPAPLTVSISASIISRLQSAAGSLDLSLNPCLLASCVALAHAINAGWRPSADAHPAAGRTYLALRVSHDLGAQFKLSAEAAGLTFSDFLRLAAVATLLALEGKDRVLWPLSFTVGDFEKASEYSKY